MAYRSGNNPWARLFDIVERNTEMAQPFPAEAERLFASLFADFHRQERAIAEREAKEHPERFRNSQLMERGASTAYRYYSVPGQAKGKAIRFCWALHRNLGGQYLSWTEVWAGNDGYRANFHGWPLKREAKEYCAERLADSKKPKAERKFVLPPWKPKR